MDEILKFILKYCTEMYKRYGFKFTDSEVTAAFGGNAFIMLENDRLKLRFISDRGQLFLDFHSKYDKRKNNWYSIDLVRQMVSGEDKYFSLLDENNGEFIQENIELIFEKFNVDVIEQTIENLNMLRKKRTKVLFG